MVPEYGSLHRRHVILNYCNLCSQGRNSSRVRHDTQAVKAAGPFMVTLGFFVVLPIVWQLPICFITAELATTFQVRFAPLAKRAVAWGRA